MRKLYKFSHSVSQGGFFYCHRVNEGIIKNKQGLRNALNEIAKKFELIDVTIKIYGGVFLIFFMMKPSVKPTDIIDSIHKNISSFVIWDKKYVYSSVYDLQENHLRKILEKMGLDYDKG